MATWPPIDALRAWALTHPTLRARIVTALEVKEAILLSDLRGSAKDPTAKQEAAEHYLAAVRAARALLESV